MDSILSLILVLVVVVLIVLFVTEPFTLRQRRKAESNPALSSLLAERDRVLTALKELDFDNSLGKIPVESYPQQRLSLVQQGAQILRDLDQLAPVQEPVQAFTAAADDPVEAFLAARRAARQRENRTDQAAAVNPGKSLFCSQCGRTLHSEDRFCPACGQAVR